MERSLAARSPIGRLAGPDPLRARLPARALLRSGLAGPAWAWAHRSVRVALAGLLLGLGVLTGGWVWLRHSSFVAVERIRISGVHGPEARAIEQALQGAARHMSTLDVRTAALSSAVAPFRVVQAVKAVPRFPHGLQIEVIEQLPVAALVAGGVRTAVAGNGIVLGPALLSSALPTVAAAAVPAVGQRVSDWTVRAALTVMAGAPGPLLALAARVYFGPAGLTVTMRSGLQAYFGDATRPHAKWASLARVLADPGSAGASYVDVRLPSRPAAGFPAGTSPPLAGATAGASGGEQQAPGSESTIGALAAGLGASVAATTPSTGTSPTTSSAPASEGESSPTTSSAPASEAGSSAAATTAPSGEAGSAAGSSAAESSQGPSAGG